MTTLKLGKAKADYQYEDKAAEVALRDRDGEPYTAPNEKPATALVIGEYAKVYRQRDHAIAKKYLKRMQSRDTAHIEAMGVERIAASIVGWRDLTDDDGQEIVYSPETAIELLTELPHLREQIIDAHKDHRSFFTNASSA